MKPSMNIPGESGLTVPAGFFDGLADQILAKIRKEECAAELKQLSPLLYSLQGENVFTVPRGYFNGLADQVQSAIKPPAKVIGFSIRKNIFRYAAAAMITGIIAVSGWFIVNNSDQENGTASTPAFIKESKQYSSLQKIEEGIADLSDEAIIKYLESTGTEADNELLANNIMEQELPAQTDYLLNEKTLETYLNEIDSQTDN